MKKELQKIIKNPKGKLICFDLDGTLSYGEFWGEGHSKEPEPNLKMIQLCQDIVRAGGFVVIYTARDVSMAQETQAWLTKHNVWYHGINHGRKPGADLYVDDRALNVDDVCNTK